MCFLSKYMIAFADLILLKISFLNTSIFPIMRNFQKRIEDRHSCPVFPFNLTRHYFAMKRGNDRDNHRVIKKKDGQLVLSFFTIAQDSLYSFMYRASNKQIVSVHFPSF